MIDLEINKDNFLLYAVKHYDNNSCLSIKDFQDDLKRFKYIKRLLKRYKKTGVLSERLLLNHIILLHNVFNQAVVSMLFFKIEEEFWPQLKTFLVFLNYIKDDYVINNNTPHSNVELDNTIINILRKV